MTSWLLILKPLKAGCHEKVIHTSNAPAAIGAYSQAVLAGDTLYVSGQLGIDPTTGELAQGFDAQAKQVFDNLEAILQEAGAGLDKVVKFNVSMTDLADFAKLNEVFAAR